MKVLGVILALCLGMGNVVLADQLDNSNNPKEFRLVKQDATGKVIAEYSLKDIPEGLKNGSVQKLSEKDALPFFESKLLPEARDSNKVASLNDSVTNQLERAGSTAACGWRCRGWGCGGYYGGYYGGGYYGGSYGGGYNGYYGGYYPYYNNYYGGGYYGGGCGYGGCGGYWQPAYYYYYPSYGCYYGLYWR